MKRVFATGLLFALAGCSKGDPGGDAWGFTSDFRSSHYLMEAGRLQELGAPAREAALREMSLNSKRGSEVYPLCRMLFEAKEGKEFRAPRIGAPSFAGTTNAADWPLDPITMHRGVPILVVRGHTLFGLPEPPLKYLEYCLAECRWSDQKFAPVDQQSRRRIMSEFIRSQPKLAEDAEWLRKQAE